VLRLSIFARETLKKRQNRADGRIKERANGAQRADLLSARGPRSASGFATRAIREARKAARAVEEIDGLQVELVVTARMRGCAEYGESWVAAGKLLRDEREIAAAIRAHRAALNAEAPNEAAVVDEFAAAYRGLPVALQARVLEALGADARPLH